MTHSPQFVQSSIRYTGYIPSWMHHAPPMPRLGSYEQGQAWCWYLWSWGPLEVTSSNIDEKGSKKKNIFFADFKKQIGHYGSPALNMFQKMILFLHIFSIRNGKLQDYLARSNVPQKLEADLMDPYCRCLTILGLSELMNLNIQPVMWCLCI